MIIVSESIKNLYETINKKVNLCESNKILYESISQNDNLSESAKDGLEKSKRWVEEEKSAKSVSNDNKDLLIKGGGDLLHAALGPWVGLASGFILKSAVSDDHCKIAKNGLEKGQNWVEEKVRATGISDERRDLLVRSGGALVLAPAIGYWGGIGSAFGFLLRCVPSDNYYYQMAKNRIETSKSWAGEKIRAKGISDEQMNFLIKAGGALALAASIGYYGLKRGSGSANASDDDIEKLMKAPGRPGEFIKRAAFEANPRAYFRELRGKYPW